MSVSGISGAYKTCNDYSSPISKNGVPNWGRIPHKGMPRPTDEEFNTIIEDLGKALAAAKNNNDKKQYDAIYEKVEVALAQYISVVSPDRKAMVNEAMQFINKSVPRKGGGAQPTLIDILNKADGIVTPANDGRFSIALNSGTIITFSGSDLQPDFFDIKSGFGGIPVIGYHNGEWVIQLTSQEKAMQDSFLARLNSTIARYSGQGVALAPQPEGKVDIRV